MRLRRAQRASLLLGVACFIVFLLFLANPELRVYSTQYESWTEWDSEERTPSLQQGEATSTSSDQTMRVRERLFKDFFLGGHMFDERGRAGPIGSDVTSCLLHSFSPYIEREAAKRFMDPPHSNVYFANSPAVIWYKGELVLVSRIWLDREIYDLEKENQWPENEFADNWLYTQKFDSHLRPISNGTIIGIPSPKQFSVGDGPIEPRLVVVKNQLFISFNVVMAFKYKHYIDYTVLWDYDRNIAIIPKIKGGSLMVNATQKGQRVRDKHWMPLVQKDELFFVYNLDPLIIMHCQLNGSCEFVHSEQPENYVFQHRVFHLRGGTPFELYEWPYYIGIAHATMYKQSNNHRHYTAHMVVLCVEPYRIVYLSHELQVNEKIYDIYPIVRRRFMEEGFVFPVGLILEGRDVMNIGVHVSDHSSVIIRVRGIEELMDTVIQVDRENSPLHGPPVSYLHQHIHDAMENETHVMFRH